MTSKSLSHLSTEYLVFCLMGGIIILNVKRRGSQNQLTNIVDGNIVILLMKIWKVGTIYMANWTIHILFVFSKILCQNTTQLVFFH